MEVGDYIRTESGNIYQIRKIEKSISTIGQTIYWVKEFYLLKEDIKSHSKDIIDLIEVGDYVNGMRVIATENRGRYNEEKQKDEKVILAENYDEWTENGVISNEDIKTILTHEMYEQNCYKLKE